MDSQEKTFFIAVLLIVLLLGVLFAGFVTFLVQQGRLYRRLKASYVSAQATVEERERQRIGGDLHDEVCTLLVAARLELAQAVAADAGWAGRLAHCDRLLKEGLERARGLAHCLRPALLEQVGLEQSLRMFVDSLPPAFGRKVLFQYRVDARLDEMVELSLYRIVQELLQNALKHAGCRRLLVQVKEADGRIYFHYMDDGRGFCYEPWRQPAGQGLYSIQSRVTMLGGSLLINTIPV